MSTFKLKPEKAKFYSCHHTTVDSTHQKFAEKFKSDEEALPQKKAKLQNLERRLRALENKKKENYTTKDIKNKSIFKSTIINLKNEIKDTQNNVGELEYYSMTGDLLMDYYDMIEKYDEENQEQNEGSSDEHEQTAQEKEEEQENKGNETLYDMSNLDQLNCLSKKNKKKKIKKIPKKRRKRVTKSSDGNIFSYFGIDTEKSDEHDLEQNRASILDEFLTMIDNDYISHKPSVYNPIKECTVCNKEKTLVQSEGCYICRSCGEVEYVVIESERPSYKDPVPEKSGYPYKRINHFSELNSTSV